jgi:hypothetical protein
MSKQSEFEKALTEYGNISFEAGACQIDPAKRLDHNYAEYSELLKRCEVLKEAVRAVPCVTRISTNSEGKAFTIYLRDGTKIVLGRGPYHSCWIEHVKQEVIKPAEVQYGKDPYEA